MRLGRAVVLKKSPPFSEENLANAVCQSVWPGELPSWRRSPEIGFVVKLLLSRWFFWPKGGIRYEDETIGFFEFDGYWGTVAAGLFDIQTIIKLHWMVSRFMGGLDNSAKSSKNIECAGDNLTRPSNHVKLMINMVVDRVWI